MHAQAARVPTTAGTCCLRCVLAPPRPALHHRHIAQEVGHAAADLTVSTMMYLHTRKSLDSNAHLYMCHSGASVALRGRRSAAQLALAPARNEKTEIQNPRPEEP